MIEDFIADEAPGAPGALSNSCGGAKQAVDTSPGASGVRFTVVQGILNQARLLQVAAQRV